METKKMGEIYQKIASKLNEMIPIEWEELYLYGEVIENHSTSSYFYYLPGGGDKFEQGLCIDEDYNVDKDIFKNQRREVFSYCEELFKEFKDNNPEPWSNFTMYLSRTGKLKIDFEYDDVLKINSFDRRIIWLYRYLGMYPSHPDDIKLVEEYIKNNSDKN